MNVFSPLSQVSSAKAGPATEVCPSAERQRENWPMNALRS